MTDKLVLIEAEFDYCATVTDMLQCQDRLNSMDCNCANTSRWVIGSIEIKTTHETRAVNILKKYPVSMIRIYDMIDGTRYRPVWSTVRKEIGEYRIQKRWKEIQQGAQ